MDLLVKGPDDEKKIAFPVNRVYCAGYAGRNQAKVREHIEELAKIGVPAPARTPTVYSVSPYLLTNAPVLTVQGPQTSGEVEFVLFIANGQLFVTVGSDHTDRELEKSDIARSKQACVKPVANEAWRFEELTGHWDSLILRSWITDAKGKTLYQQGEVTALLPVPELLKVIKRETDRPLEGAVIFSGTIPVHGGFNYATVWDLELEDPVLGRKISHHYELTVLEEEMKA